MIYLRKYDEVLITWIYKLANIKAKIYEYK